MSATRADVDCNLTEYSLDLVRVKLGAERASDLLICCGESTATEARKLQAVHGFSLRTVPDAILRTPTTWCASYRDRMSRVLWTEGA